MVRYTLALFLASLATGAHADVVCRSRSGALSLRKTCHKRQMLVPPSSLGIMGGLVVKDSKGALVGFVIGSTFTPAFTAPNESVDDHVTPVVRQVGNTWVEFRVSARGSFGFDTPAADSFAYDSTDCTGTPLVIVNPDAMMSLAFVGLDEVETYAILPGTPRMFHSASFLPPAGQTCAFTLLANGMCCKTNLPTSPTNPEKYLADTTTLDLSALGLVPPFHVESE